MDKKAVATVRHVNLKARLQNRMPPSQFAPRCSCGCNRSVYKAYLQNGRSIEFDFENETIYIGAVAECSERLAIQRPELKASLLNALCAKNKSSNGRGSGPIQKVLSAISSDSDTIDGLPNINEFADVFLTFGADLLQRVGISKHRDHYLSKLTPEIKDNFLNRRHCMFTFLADTTTMTFVQHCIEPYMMNGANLLYNLVVGVVVLNSRERFLHMAPFDINSPMSSEEFVAKFEPRFGRRAPPKALLQGVQNILNRYGAGEHFQNSASFVEDMGRRIPTAWLEIEKARGQPDAPDAVLTTLRNIGITPFASLVIARLLSLADPSLFDLGSYQIGDGAKTGLGIVAGAADPKELGKQDILPRFQSLVQNLPGVLRTKDAHGIIDALGEQNMYPLVAQTVEHMLCEYRKMHTPGRDGGGPRTPQDEYTMIFQCCRKTYKRHAAMRACL
jgi:hypothetical protein